MKKIILILTVGIANTIFSQVKNFSEATNNSLNSFLANNSKLKQNQSPLIVIEGNPFYNIDEIPQLENDDISSLKYLSNSIIDLQKIWGAENTKNGVLLIFKKTNEPEINKPMNESKILLILDGKIISENDFEKIDYKKTVEKIDIIKSLRNPFRAIDGNNYDGIFIMNSYKTK